MPGTIADIAGDSPVVRRLHELRLAHEEAVRVARDAASAVPALEREVADLKERAIEAWSRNERKEAEKIEGRLAQAERDLASQPHQAAGLERAALRAHGELKAHIRQNYADLRAAHQPAGEEATAQLERLLVQIQDAVRAYDAEGGVIAQLVTFADRGSDMRASSTPQSVLDIARAARAVMSNGGVPVPTTHALRFA
jgi:hypothetical protein